MPGRPRKPRYEIQSKFNSTSEFVHDLLVRELGAKLVPDSDKTVPQPWAPPRLTEKELKELMGFFDDLAADGVDLGQVELDPKFNYPDGTYVMAFAKAVFKPRKQKDWNDQIETTYLIVSMADGEDTAFRGKKYTEWLAIPDAKQIKSDDNEIRERAQGALNRTFQRLYQLGIEDPKSCSAEDLAELIGIQYVVTLNTPKDNNEKKKQFISGKVTPLNEMQNSSNPFDEDEE